MPKKIRKNGVLEDNLEEEEKILKEKLLQTN